MKLSELPQTTFKSKKRIGRGHGSGRGGHTSTRGSKGQNSRGRVGLFFEGTKIKKSLLKRLPLFRGKGKFKSHQKSSYVVNLKYLGIFKENDEITLDSLKTKGIVSSDLPENAKIKILGEGEISLPLTVCLAVSKGAEEKIIKAGGKILKKEPIKKEEKKEEKSKQEIPVKKNTRVKKEKPSEAK